MLICETQNEKTQLLYLFYLSDGDSAGPAVSSFMPWVVAKLKYYHVILPQKSFQS